MTNVLYACDAVKDRVRVRFRFWPDVLDWFQDESAARTLLVPIREQLALSPLVAQARAAGASALSLRDITSYEVHVKEGQINLQLMDGSWVVFHTVPARKSQKVKELLDQVMPTIIRTAPATPTVPASTGLPPAGWMTDPDESAQLRWWTGTEWGDFRKPA